MFRADRSRRARQLGPRHHHRADLPVVEAEHVAHHLVLLGLDDAGVHALFQAGGDLLFRHGAGRAARQPQQLQDGLRAGRQQRHEGLGGGGQPVHGPGHQPRHGLGKHLADALGHQLAEDDGEVGDQDDHEGRGGDERRLVGDAEGGDDPVGQRPGEGRLADDAVEQADRRDANLHRRQPARGVVVQHHCRIGPTIATIHQHLQPGLARRRQAHLGHRKRPVEQDQEHQ
jgi:hypothetical protein